MSLDSSFIQLKATNLRDGFVLLFCLKHHLYKIFGKFCEIQPKPASMGDESSISFPYKRIPFLSGNVSLAAKPIGLMPKE
jgi:hypothetical protein